jgi:uncharacterized damage-inducible protein DinB
MTLDYARTLVDYHYWARDRMLDAVAALDADAYVRDLGSSFPSVRDTLQHTYGAEVVSLQRWCGETPATFPATFPDDVHGLRDAWRAHELAFRAFVDSLDDAALQQVVHYRLLSGAEASSALWQMLVHVVNHATYHRGQVTTLLRQLGADAPASTDMIAFFGSAALLAHPALGALHAAPAPSRRCGGRERPTGRPFARAS